MKLIAELGDEKNEIELNRDGEKVSAKINGREYELEASQVEPDVYLLKHDHKIYQVYVAPNGVVNVGDNQFEIKLSDPKRLRGAGGAGAEAGGASEIKTAMPGKIVRILVEPGAEIKKGDGVIIVEAMKMQNEMKSPKDGIVKEIRVAESSTVGAGDVLAIIE